MIGINGMCSVPRRTVLCPLSNLVVPNDFPKDPYLIIHKNVTSYQPASDIGPDVSSDVQSEFRAAWNGIAYRYKACERYGRIFTRSIKSVGDGPSVPQRFVQDHALFGFFVSGLSTLECLCYGAFAIGHMLMPNAFPFLPNERWNIDVGKTKARFVSAFPTESFSKLLVELHDGASFKDWKKARNILAHRMAPGRSFHVSVGAPVNKPTTMPQLLDMPMDESTIVLRWEWLSTSVLALLNDLEQIVSKRVAAVL
jgi:hypothetical protein